MVKILNITVSDETHALLERIKKERGFNNHAEVLEWVIQKAAEAS